MQADRPDLSHPSQTYSEENFEVTISFDRVAHVYDATRGMTQEAEERVADAIVRLAGATPETRFVEPGVGTGRIALPLIRRGYDDYAGVDVSEPMMDEFRRKLGSMPSRRLRLLRADARALLFADDSFDVAIIAHVLHLMPDWHRALAEVRRVLRPGGVLLYCQQDWDESSALTLFSRQWEAILDRYGVDAKILGARKPEVLQTLREQGAELDSTVAATWSKPTTVGEVLDGYANRVHSPDWRVPEEVFGGAMEELRAWAAERYPSEKTPLADEITMEITAARRWT
jgi:ubiquinone/menaquinone biosynthesis C-methylase UbiE